MISSFMGEKLKGMRDIWEANCRLDELEPDQAAGCFPLFVARV